MLLLQLLLLFGEVMYIKVSWGGVVFWVWSSVDWSSGVGGVGGCIGCIVVVANLVGFEYFWNDDVFTGFDTAPTPFDKSFKGFIGGKDLDNESRSWAASVSSLVRTRCVGSVVEDASEEFDATLIEEDVGGCGWMFARISGGIGVVQLSPMVVGSILMVVTSGARLACGNVIDSVFFNPGLESGEMFDVCAVATVGDIDEGCAPERKNEK